MARLFISLYLFIAVMLVAVSALLDQLLDDEAGTLPPAIMLGAALLEASEQSPGAAASLAEKAGFSTRRIPLSDFNWLAQDIEALRSGKVITLFDSQRGYQFYVLEGDNTLVEITDPSHRPPPPLVMYSGLFFLLLGVMLAFWVWPLWRDLHRLQQAADNQSEDGLMADVELSKTSLIKPIADALNGMSRRVATLMQTQRELTGAVAHEFRTPLSRLKFALAIKPTPGSSPWQAMNHDVDELETLVEEMLSYTSMESHQPELNMSSIPVSELCREVAEKLPEETTQALLIEVTRADIHVSADAHFLERAVQNLVINACRYAQTRVDVTIRRYQGGIEIGVEDDGPGVEDALKEKIFEPFYRPDEGRDRRRGGAGLGLAIVRRIMLWHHGQCWVESGQSGGARFVLRFVQEVAAP